MESGYTSLQRKIWNHPFLVEKGKRFSRLEAWLYLVNVQARGVDGCDLMRGEFCVSYRQLAAKWNWSLDATHRFFKGLLRENMIEKSPFRNSISAERQPERQPERFIITNYSTYNPPPNATPNATPNILKKEERKNKELLITIASHDSVEQSTDDGKFKIPLKDGSTFTIPDRQIETYRLAYKKIDVEAELLRYVAWAESNPAKRKTRGGILKSVNSWLSSKDSTAQAQQKISTLNFGKAL